MRRKLSLITFSSSALFLLLMQSNASAKTDGESPQRDLTGFESVDESQPLWEVGIGGGALNTTKYPASSERNEVVLAAPYFIYRGEVLRIGGGGIRAVVVEDSDFELDMSFGGAFSAKNDDDSIRAGMPDLDYLFEVGPQAIYRLHDFSFAQGGAGRLKARLQARAAFSTDFNEIDSRGYVFEPTLSYQQRGVFFDDASLNLAFNVVFATEKFQQYYYQVDQSYATNERRQYDAKGGYLGSELSMSISFPIGYDIRTFFGGSAKFFNGASNENSPLFEDDFTYTVGIGFVWRAYASETKASW